MMKKGFRKDIPLYYRKGLIFFAHFGAILFSYLVSFLLRFEFSLPKDDSNAFYIGLIGLVITKPVVFWALPWIMGLCLNR